MDSSFAIVRKADQTVLLLPEFREAALRILGLEGTTPGAEGSASSNRGLYPRFPLDTGRRAILKHYRHGGLLARMAGDLFFGLRRPFLEFQLSERARRAGIPTSTLIAARVRSVAKLFYRGDVLLLEIPGALDAGDLVRTPPQAGRARNRAVRSLASAVRRMHDAGLRHADLNLKNLILSGEQVAYVIDLDRGRFLDGALDADARAANLLRLARSFLKAGGDRLQSSLPHRFLAAYSRGDGSLRRALRRRLQTYPLAFHLHRLGWRLAGRGQAA